MKKVSIVAFIFLISQSIESANILGIFPTASISHQVVFRALMKDLAERGHQLTILTTDPVNTKNPNVTEIDLHFSYEAFRNAVNFADFRNKKLDESDLVKAFAPVMLSIIEKQLSYPQVKELITNKDKYKFDVVLLEYLSYIPYLAFGELYDCPIIAVTSLDTLTENHEFNGNEFNPVIHSEFVFPYAHGQLAFNERWRSLKYYLKTKFSVAPIREKQFLDQITRHFPTVKSSITDLRTRVQLIMTNTNPAMGFIRPLLPNTIQLGFMHIEPPKALPESELKAFLDNSKKGVIYMSLGSNVQSKDLGPEVQKIFLNVFGSLDYDVLWKFEADNLPNKPKNVMISKWLPQSDLLAHPKIKIFITQGGQQSMEEAIDRMVPMIVIPFLADQDVNARRIAEKKIGCFTDLHSITETKLKDLIEEMLKPKYKINIAKLRELVHDQPMTSRDRAVWWTEYVIRHKGAKHLEYVGRLVPFYQRYCLDFISIFIVGLVVALKLLVTVFKFFLGSKKIKKE